MGHARDSNEFLEVFGNELRPVIGDDPGPRFDVQDFGRRAVDVGPGTRTYPHVAMTVHRPGFGLDEAECFRALIAGISEGARGADTIERISVLEADGRRAAHFRSILDKVLPNRTISTKAGAKGRRGFYDVVGAGWREKPYAFVAMPFAPEFDDLFHYGIQGAVNAAGYLCERADLTAFTGDVLSWVQDRIVKAKVVVADLTGANANVYLEVGYAWGRQIPTVLLARDVEDLKFDVRGQRCLLYKNIRHLEETLRRELARLAETL